LRVEPIVDDAVTAKLEVVAPVKVAFTPVRFWIEALVWTAVVEKRFVEVALVVVAFVAVIPAKVRLGVVVALFGNK
jgi:hypothetical protein